MNIDNGRLISDQQWELFWQNNLPETCLAVDIIIDFNYQTQSIIDEYRYGLSVYQRLCGGASLTIHSIKSAKDLESCSFSSDSVIVLSDFGELTGSQEDKLLWRNFVANTDCDNARTELLFLLGVVAPSELIVDRKKDYLVAALAFAFLPDSYALTHMARALNASPSDVVLAANSKWIEYTASGCMQMSFDGYRHCRDFVMSMGKEDTAAVLFAIRSYWPALKPHRVALEQLALFQLSLHQMPDVTELINMTNVHPNKSGAIIGFWRGANRFIESLRPLETISELEPIFRCSDEINSKKCVV